MNKLHSIVSRVCVPALIAGFGLLLADLSPLNAQLLNRDSNGCACCPSACESPYMSDATLPSPESDDPLLQSENLPQFDISEQFASVGGDSFIGADAATNGGYIDGAIPMDQLRFRFDAAYDNPLPDRAEFFYAQCGCNGGAANGPPNPEVGVDYQEFNIYFERTLTHRLSLFIDAPIRLLNPVINTNTAGFSDLQAGMKYALVAEPDRYLTFQLRVYTPTGDANAGLGTGHASLEPGLLYFHRFTPLTTMEAELRHWIPLTNSVLAGTGRPYHGNVLRYGVGVAHVLASSDCGCRNPVQLSAVGEAVGWSFLGGQALAFNPPGTPPTIIDVDGQTVVNLKLGARLTAGRHSVYAGFGHAVTGSVLYRDIFRLEYRWLF